MTLLAENTATSMLWVAGPALCCLVTSPPVKAQESQARPILRSLSGASSRELLARIDRRQLPPGAKIDESQAQTLLLSRTGSTPLGIAAISYHWDPASADQGGPEQCGVFFVQAKGPSHYVPVMGGPQTQDNQLCENPVAVGLAGDPGPHPRLIFIFMQMLTVDRPASFVFTWNQKTDTYDRDDATCKWLWHQPKPSDTVVQVRQLLRTQPTSS